MLVALAYPREKPTDQAQEDMRQYWNAVASTLPCPGCRVHATTYLKQHPVDVTDQQKLLAWIVTFHNTVNDRTGKKSDWTVDEAITALTRRIGGDKSNELSKAQAMRAEDHALIRRQRIQLRVLEKRLAEVSANDGITFGVDDIVDAAADAIIDSGGVPRATSVKRNASKSADGSNTSGTSPYSIATVVILSIMLILVVSVVALIAIKHRKGKGDGVAQ